MGHLTKLCLSFVLGVVPNAPLLFYQGQSAPEQSAVCQCCADCKCEDCSCDPASPGEPRFPVVVRRVKDGDTFVGDVHLPWNITLRYQSIRPVGYDAPERNEDGGPEATAWLKGLVSTGNVWIVPGDDRGRDRDNFGRALGRVWIDGKDGWVALDAEAERKGHVKDVKRR